MTKTKTKRIYKLPDTAQYSVKHLKNIEEGEELDLIIACAFDHVIEGENKGDPYSFTFKDTNQVFDFPVRYSRDPFFLQFMLEQTAPLKNLEDKTRRSSRYKRDSVGIYYFEDWSAGPTCHEGVEPFVYGPSLLLAMSRYVSLLWKWKYLPPPAPASFDDDYQ